MSIKQIDDALIHGLATPKPVEAKAVESQPEPEKVEEVSQAESQSAADNQTEEVKADTGEAAKTDSKKPEPVKAETKDAAELDEYGIEKPKARTYTEEEVQRMIRDRLSRGQHATPQQQAAVQQAANNFQLDPNSSDSWEVQLKEFVKNTLNEVTHEEKTKAWQREEHERQTNFEVKFSTGMEKYADFKEVTRNMPITDSMMMAIRDMDNPAQFIYAAAKLQPKELERIANINDPFQQAKEMGRLDERMRKAKTVSKTAIPLKSVTSDVTTAPKVAPKKDIDSLINAHAKSKLRASK